MKAGRRKRGRGKLSQFAISSPLMTAVEVATLVKAHVRTINRMVEAGTIPYFRVGAGVRFNRERIDAWMRERAKRGPEINP
jgi:excisionase family DNA binding protein